MKSLLAFIFLFFTMHTTAQEIIPLYPGAIPGAIDTDDQERSETRPDGTVIVSGISRPTLRIYLPEKEKATGMSVIIFPGGGYRINAIKHEGWDVAEYLRDNGIAAFVVKYRIPDSNTMAFPDKGPLQDAQQAIRLVRERANEFGIDPDKLGVMGFSAGGHLASTASTHYRYNSGASLLRPAFSVLVYPVISFSDSIGHSGSKLNLLGKDPQPSMVDHYSNETQVDSNTPPAFLVHAKDDPVNYRNSVVYEEALKRNGVPVKTLYFEQGGHGYGMWNKKSTQQWPPMMLEWLRSLY